MKNTGVSLIIIGVVLMIITSIDYFTREKVVEVGSLVVTAKKARVISWSPYLGGGLLVAGLVIVASARRKKI